MPGGDFSSLCPVPERIQGVHFVFPKMAKTLILVGETLPWYRSDLLGLPILGGHPRYQTSPITAHVVMMMGFSFCPFPTQIKALLIYRTFY